MKKKKSKRELITELHDSWVFRDGKLGYSDEYPWVADLITYVHIEIDEPMNDHVLRIIHAYSLYMNNYANAIEIVNFEGFLKNGALVTQNHVSMRYFKEWLALPNTHREFFCDKFIRSMKEVEDYPEELDDITNILSGGYHEWSKYVLSYVGQYFLRNSEKGKGE